MKNKRGHAMIGALTLIPMLGFAALSVDIGLQRVINVQMQTSFDSAVLSGVGYLDGTSQGVNLAIQETINVATNNSIYYDYVISAEDVVVGKYENGQFTTLDVSNFKDINAIRISDNHLYNSILAGAAFNVVNLESSAAATAVRRSGGGAKYVNCYLPFAIPACHFVALDDGTNPEPMMLDLMNLNTVGWGLPNTNPSTTTIKEQLADVCAAGQAQTYDDETGDNTSNNVSLSNGQNNSAATFIGDIINGFEPDSPPSVWPSNYFGNTPSRDGLTANLPENSLIDPINWGLNVQGVVPIVDQGCGEGFTGDARILGWTYAYIYDAKTSGAGGKNVWIQFDFINEYDIGYGYDPDALGNVLGTVPAQLVN